MARTKGAKDRVKRKQSRPATPKPAGQTVTPVQPATKPVQPATKPTADSKPAGASPIDSAEFLRECDRQIGTGSGPPPAAAPLPGAPTAPPAEPAAEIPLTQDAWAGVCRVPFRLVSHLTGYDSPKTIGEKRSKDLARASWPIFNHYATEYMHMHPDDPLSLAWAATGLVLADIGEQIFEGVMAERAARAAAVSRKQQAQAVEPPANL